MTEWAPLRYLTFSLVRGTAPDYVDDGPVRVVSQAANQFGGIDWERTKFHDFTGNPERLRGNLQRGDVLVNSTGTGTLGRVGWFEKGPDSRPCVADGHVTKVRFDPHQMDGRFGYYCLSSDSFQEFMFETLISGSTNQIELNGERMRAASVPVPPLEEQRRIADFLDTETARIDDLIRYKARQARLIRDRSNAIIDDCVSDLEKEYGLIKLRRLIASIEQGWSPVAENQQASEGEWGVLKTASVTSGAFLAHEHKRLTDETQPDTRYQVKDGDLLVTRGSGSARNVGTAAVAKVGSQKMMLSDLIYRVGLPRSCIPSYVSLCLNSDPVRARIALLLRGQSGQTVKLRATDIGEIEVPAISRGTQQSIVSRAEQTKARHEKLSDVIETSACQLAERRQAVITTTVTGQVDVATASSGSPSTRT